MFKIHAKHSPYELCSVPKSKKAVMCHIGNIHVLDGLYSGMSGSSISHEFNVNQSIVHIK